MGVKTLWPVVDCVSEHLDLRQLRGQRLAIDLAGWVVQTNTCKAMSGRVAKPHLRNVFFRTCALLALDIKPVFVLDGDAPSLKGLTLGLRRAAETGGEAKQQQDLSRRRLKSVQSECRYLLAALGLECVQAGGEGEALCAALDSLGMVDGVFTEDSDAFCYGARTVLRGLSVAAKTYSVDRVSSKEVAEKLGLSRDRILFMAVMLGCDFFPSGVNGVGKESVMQLFTGWSRAWDAMRILGYWIRVSFEPSVASCTVCKGSLGAHCGKCDLWKSCTLGSECLCAHLASKADLVKLENAMKKKCLALGMEWWRDDYPKLISEFEIPSEVRHNFAAPQCPKFEQCMSILLNKLQWTHEYALEKLLPIVTRWQVQHRATGGLLEVIEPVKMLKKRVANGVACVSVSWTAVSTAPEENIKGLPEQFESCEPSDLLEKAYPEFLKSFLESLAKPKRKPKPVVERPKTKAKEKENAPPQKQITKFFTQRKTSSAARSLCKAKTPLKPSPELSVLSDLSLTDCSDLSLVVDEILSKRVQDISMKADCVVVTSTPSISRTAPRDVSMNSVSFMDMSACADQDIKNSGSILEDTFDRMCK